MSKNRIGIGFIGGGFITRFHIQSLISVRNCDVVGVMSRTRASAEESADLARDIGVGDDAKAYDTITDMIADPNIDALWVCSPNFARIETFEEIADAISSGKGELVGVTCEKPLGRNFEEAQKVKELTESVGLLDGYLENQVFSPSITRGKEIVWSRGAATTGRPYLARAAEEHSGPHMPWFWEGSLQGGGVLNDMMCHSVEEARFMLTEPGKPRDSITPISISAHTDCLKWQRPEYVKILSDNSGGKTDYSQRPSEDFARSLIEYLDEDGNKLIVETTTSWCFVGEGLRLSMELFGPEYSMFVNTLDPDLKVFFSRKVAGAEGEDLVEKQNAESGGMPVVSNEAEVYGYTAENRHMVESFLAGKRPEENFDDGLDVTRLLMAAYMSAEQGKTIKLPNKDIETFIPAVARGEWNPKG
ncbi:MAG: Gfo/Idh/MocA family oxidoreductase [Candidatus Marinimicrobia bacterium]|nr:Gfo/Idh/MocA family oxidoreductase [Candidatus Neomarinimicrobiota bacterium]MDD9887066.1 Gfo/Idh/MocA family oxidoreductase [Candidatus Neomarinimicrobiota bacterium]MDD9931717.1 Gfo/Idh/MocA family oxidoreductase [Candidatus Neomarinimicrobiota bacterium]